MTYRNATRLLVATLVVLAGSVKLLPRAAAQDAPAEEPKPEAVETNMHEFMEYYFQPTYLQLREAMKAAPADRQGWRGIKSGALILADGANLLLTRGPVDDRGAWEEQTVAVRAAGAEMYKAAKMSNFEQATEHYRTMLNACNACHNEYAGGEHQLAP